MLRVMVLSFRELLKMKLCLIRSPLPRVSNSFVPIAMQHCFHGQVYFYMKSKSEYQKKVFLMF